MNKEQSASGPLEMDLIRVSIAIAPFSMSYHNCLWCMYEHKVSLEAFRAIGPALVSTIIMKDYSLVVD